MKAGWVICFVGLLASSAFATTWKPDAKLLEAISHVESTGGIHLVGDAGNSLGEFQMSLAAWEDVNAWRKDRKLKTYSYQQHVFHPYINRVYASNYLTIIHAQLKKQLKRKPTVEEIYATYNMGITRFEQLNFDISRVNKTTAAKAATIRQMVAKN